MRRLIIACLMLTCALLVAMVQPSKLAFMLQLTSSFCLMEYALTTHP